MSKSSKDSKTRKITSLIKVKLPVEELKVGMYVCELDRPWEETPFLFQGFYLRNLKHVNAVRERCAFVYIDVSKEEKSDTGYGKKITPSEEMNSYERALLETPADIVEKRVEAPAPKKECSFEHEMEKASIIHQETSGLIKMMMEEVRLGNSIDGRTARDAVRECVSSVIANPDTMMWLTQLKKRDEYTSEHSLNVCLLAIAFGRHLGMPAHKLEQLGLCGMLHDMGKMLTPPEVLNKPGKLTPEEFSIIKQHPVDGRDILVSGGGVFPGAIEVAYAHHERLTGGGYPRGIEKENISPYTMMVSIVDAYDAITSDRVYDHGRTHLDALNVLSKGRDSQFDAGYTVQFIRCIGIFPPGCVVELSNGEVGIVTEVDPANRLRPKIVLLLNKKKKPIPALTIDLMKVVPDANGNPYRIKRVVSPKKYNIDIHKYHKNKTVITAKVVA